MSWQFNQDNNTYQWINDGQGDPSTQPSGSPAAGATGGASAATGGGWHPQQPPYAWPQYPSGDLAQYGLGYANLADQILAAHQRPGLLSQSALYGNGAGRYAYARDSAHGAPYNTAAGRSAPWDAAGNNMWGIGGGLLHTNGTVTPPGGNPGSLTNPNTTIPTAPGTDPGKPPTKIATAVPTGGNSPATAGGLLGNGGAGSAVNANYIPGVNLPWGSVASVGDPVNEYGGPTGRDLGHLWGVHYQEDGPSGYQLPVTNMSLPRYQQYMSDLAAGYTRDESNGVAYLNGVPQAGK